MHEIPWGIGRSWQGGGQGDVLAAISPACGRAVLPLWEHADHQGSAPVLSVEELDFIGPENDLRHLDFLVFITVCY